LSIYEVSNYLALNALLRKQISFSFPRTYSTAHAVVPVKIYANADKEKLQIISENKGKAGVYRWVNLISGNSYIGSSINLSRRLTDYYSIRFLEKEIKKNNSIIYRSLVKYGYSSFSFEILEYCDKSEVISREQYYLDLLKPEYNILKNAGSLLGFKHSEESKIWEHLKRLNADSEYKAKQQEQLKRLNSSKEQQEHLKRLHADPEYKAKRLEQLKHLNADPEHKAKRLAQLKVLNASQEHKEHLKRLALSLSFPIEVFDTENNETTIYPSIRQAGRAIGVTHVSISMAFKREGESTIWIKKKRYKITALRVLSSSGR
jgi:group I intron endonuclease